MRYIDESKVMRLKHIQKLLFFIVPTYRKGTINKVMELDLLQRVPQAIGRVLWLLPCSKPSSAVFEFIKVLNPTKSISIR